MPSGTEIHLGFIGPEAVDKAATAMDLKIVDEDFNEIKAAIVREDERWIEIATQPVDNAIRDAYEAIAARLGWILVSKDSRGTYTYTTPCGERETRCFSLAIQFDSDEIGDTAEDITLGINLSARYYPTVLDVCRPSKAGGSVNVFDEDIIRVCREEIAKRLPPFKDAKVFAREIFY